MYGKLPEVVIDDGNTVNGVKVRNANPQKTAVLRLPTSAEMFDYIRSVGRVSKRRNADPDLKPDLVLFGKLRLDNGDEFDEFEASRVIGGIADWGIVDTDREDGCYVVTLGTPFGEVEHRVEIPSQKAFVQYRRSISRSTTRIDAIEHACVLFDSISKGATGYAEGVEVPPHHKSGVIQAIMAALDELDPVIDPNS